MLPGWTPWFTILASTRLGMPQIASAAVEGGLLWSPPAGLPRWMSPASPVHDWPTRTTTVHSSSLSLLGTGVPSVISHTLGAPVFSSSPSLPPALNRQHLSPCTSLVLFHKPTSDGPLQLLVEYFDRTSPVQLSTPTDPANR